MAGELAPAHAARARRASRRCITSRSSTNNLQPNNNATPMTPRTQGAPWHLSVRARRPPGRTFYTAGLPVMSCMPPSMRSARSPVSPVRLRGKGGGGAGPHLVQARGAWAGGGTRCRARPHPPQGTRGAHADDVGDWLHENLPVPDLSSVRCAVVKCGGVRSEAAPFGTPPPPHTRAGGNPPSPSHPRCRRCAQLCPPASCGTHTRAGRRGLFRGASHGRATPARATHRPVTMLRQILSTKKCSSLPNSVPA